MTTFTHQAEPGQGRSQRRFPKQNVVVLSWEVPVILKRPRTSWLTSCYFVGCVLGTVHMCVEMRLHTWFVAV